MRGLVSQELHHDRRLGQHFAIVEAQGRDAPLRVDLAEGAPRRGRLVLEIDLVIIDLETSLAGDDPGREGA
jgi:hypothetical protein